MKNRTTINEYRTLVFLRVNVLNCKSNYKQHAFVNAKIEYVSLVWNPYAHSIVLHCTLGHNWLLFLLTGYKCDPENFHHRKVRSHKTCSRIKRMELQNRILWIVSSYTLVSLQALWYDSPFLKYYTILMMWTAAGFSFFVKSTYSLNLKTKSLGYFFFRPPLDNKLSSVARKHCYFINCHFVQVCAQYSMVILQI